MLRNNHRNVNMCTFGVQKTSKTVQVAAESIENIRTVQALTKEHYFYEQFCVCIRQPYEEGLRQAHMRRQ
jgi:adenylyl- and sulfurtransferase ThiI